MSFFDGSTSSKKKDVNLGGKSLKKSGAVVETKEQLAERNAKARLQREQQRAEHSAALCISLSWRVLRARSITKSRICEVVGIALNDCMHSGSALGPSDLGPPAQPVLHQLIRSLANCITSFMFLRKDNNLKLRMAVAGLHQQLLEVLTSNFGAIFACDGPSGVEIEVLTAILSRISVVELSRALRAVGSELLLSAVRDNSCSAAALALKLLSVPLWACLHHGSAPAAAAAAHHTAVTVLLCSAAADAALRGSSPLLQLLVSCCVTSTHCVRSAACLPAAQPSEVVRPSCAVVDAWRNHLLCAPKLLNLCPSVFSAHHSHSHEVWRQLLQDMLAMPAPLESSAVANIISISTAFKETKLACRLAASLPGCTHLLNSRDVVALFLGEVCPQSLCDSSTNAAAFTTWLRALSPPQLDENQELSRLMCNVIAPILRAATFAQSLPILNLCAFEAPMPALFMAQNSVDYALQVFVSSSIVDLLLTGVQLADF